jgi:transcriptional regulator
MLQGQREAGKGYLHTDGKHFVVTAGQRRYKAMLYANECMGGEFKYIECDLEEKDPTTGKPPEGPELMIRQMVDGTTQEKLCAEDQAIAIKELIEKHGFSKSEIARRLGCTDQHIRDLLKYLDAPEYIKKAVKDGHIKHTAAVRVARSQKEAQDEIRGKIEAGEDVSISDVDKASGKYKVLSFEQIQKQIEKAVNMGLSEKSKKNRDKWEGVVRGMRIAAGLEDPLK